MSSLQDEIFSELKKKISKNEYENLLSQLKINEKFSKPDYIVYNTQNELMARFITTKFGKLLEEIFEIKTGIRPKIFITSQKTKISQKDIINSQNRQKSTILNKNFNFENFIIGDSNQMAYTCAKAVAKNPGVEYNPLFIYGGSGLGKTHLLQSIGNYCIAHNKVVLCITSEQFANDLAFHIQNKSTDKFKEKYRSCDVLLIDDIALLENRNAAIEEFFNTFNELKSKDCQIVLTNDKAPKFLKGFADRLISRFESGVVADITPPELETKIKIINKKLIDNEFNIQREIVEFIASNLGDNIREIEGAMTKIRVYAKMIQEEITLDFVKKILKDQIKERLKEVKIEDIIEKVAKEFNIKPSEIQSKNRTQNVVFARRIAIFLAKNLTPNSMPKIAKFFNLKDHSAVVYNIKIVNKMINENSLLKLRLEELKNQLSKAK